MKTLFSPLQEFLKKGDMLLLSLCLLASGFGVALIFSATRYNDNNKEVAVQIVAILLGILVYILCTYVDFESFVERRTGSGCWDSASFSCCCCSHPSV